MSLPAGIMGVLELTWSVGHFRILYHDVRKHEYQVIRDLVLNKTLSIVYNTFLKKPSLKMAP